jgi:hypothetical protein
MSKDKGQLTQYFGSASEIGIAKSFECIGKDCFYGCKSLIEVIFEAGCNLKGIDESAFSWSDQLGPD